MTKLHEVLAAEDNVKQQAKKLFDDTTEKFAKKDTYFRGHVRTLGLIQRTDESAAVEAAARDERPLTSTVFETLSYMLNVWARNEDFQAQRNEANCRAKADIVVDGEVVLSGVSSHELMGLWERLRSLRTLLERTPTLDASKVWTVGDTEYAWKLKEPVSSTKVEKYPVAFKLADATDKHPAQVEKIIEEKVVGRWTEYRVSGELTAQQKADLMTCVDQLIDATAQARSRANEVEINPSVRVGATIAKRLLDAVLKSGEFGRGVGKG